MCPDTECPTSQRPGAEAPEDNLAEENESPADIASQHDETSLTRRSRAPRTLIRRPMVGRAERVLSAPKTRREKVRPLRSLVILAMVGGLIATVALPAYGAWRSPAEAAVTLEQVAADDAQSLVVASDATSEQLERGTYSATTPEEIATKKAEEAAAARARAAAAAAAAARAASPARGVFRMNLSMTAPGSGEVRWPVSNFTYASYNLFRPANRPNHNGFDMVSPAGNPIFAAASGVVRVSSEGYNGYGVAVVIDSVVGGQAVSTLYGHMTYGSRQVVSGQSVSAGQVIGAVGSTGSSTANHLHFEVKVNGGYVDPLAWLQTNAG